MLLDSVKSSLAEHNVALAGSRVVVGVSGGVDSVVLLELLIRVQALPIAVHINYGLRGDESDADEAFVGALCRSWDVELLVRQAEGSSRRKSVSVQEWARVVRYDEFRTVADQRNAPFVAVAHHTDDQAETVLSHLFRGTGLAGLAGMPFIRPIREDSRVQLIRPLLMTPRAEIVAYARQRGLDWREDSSNADRKYRRSTIRHEILPVVVAHFGEDVKSRIAATARIVSELSRVRSNDSSDAVTLAPSGRVSVSVVRLSALPDLRRSQLIIDVLRRYFPTAPRSRDIAREIGALATAQVGRSWHASGVSVVREREELLFTQDPTATDEQMIPVSLGTGVTVMLGGTAVRADLLSAIPKRLDPGTNQIAFVDADLAGDGLVLDRWREGDRMSLLGSTASQKVSDLLTNAKVPHHLRSLVRVVRSGDGRVVWIVGVRVSGDFAVHGGTQRVLMLTQVASIERDASDLVRSPVS